MFEVGAKVILLQTYGPTLRRGLKGVIMSEGTYVFGLATYVVWFPTLQVDFLVLAEDLARDHRLSLLIYSIGY